MERYVYYKDGRFLIQNGVVCDIVPDSNGLLVDVVERLWEYEKTGLEPQEIKNMQAQLNVPEKGIEF